MVKSSVFSSAKKILELKLAVVENVDPSVFASGKKKKKNLLSSELVDSSVFACKNDNKIRIGSTQKKIIKERSQVLKFTIFEVVNVECGLVTSSEVASVKSNFFSS